MSSHLDLICPDWSDLDTLWRHPHPFVLWPVGNQSLLAHWMDEAVRRGVNSCTLYLVDRAKQVQHVLEEGNYWSKKIECISLADLNEAPPAEWINRLPWQPALEKAPLDGHALLRHWLAMQFLWLDQLSRQPLRLEVQHPSGGWVGAHASIHPTATLNPPFWIGEYTSIGAYTKIGPHALVSPYSIIDEKAEVEESFILPNTYQGKYTRLHRAIAIGNILLDCQRGCRNDIEEPFILSSAQ